MRKIKKKMPKPRNPFARALHSGIFGKKVVSDKRMYNRKKIKKESLASMI